METWHLGRTAGILGRTPSGAPSFTHPNVRQGSALASRGKSLFTSRGCTGCHSIGKGKQAGPDLLGVTDRRSVDWLKRWLHAPESMYDSDSIAKGLLADAKGIKMPNLRLNDADIDALISYLAAESQKKH